MQRLRSMLQLRRPSSTADNPSKSGARRLWVAGVLVVLAVWGLTDVRHRAEIDPARPEKHRTDLTAFTEAGAAMFDGRDPYTVTNVRGWGFCYPPLAAILFAPLSVLPTQWQAVVWFAASVAAAWGSIVECRKLLRLVVQSDHADRSDEKRYARHVWLLALAIATALLPALNSLQRGQVDLLKLYLVLLGIRLAWCGGSRRAQFAGGLALAAAVVLKVTPLLPAVVIAFMAVARVAASPSAHRAPNVSRLGAIAGGLAMGAALFLFLVPSAFVGPAANWRHLNTFATSQLTRVNDYAHADRTGNTFTVRNQSFSNAAIRCGNFLAHLAGGRDDRALDSPRPRKRPLAMEAAWIPPALLVARAGFVLGLLATGIIAACRRDSSAELVVLGLACTAALVVSPISRGSYFAELAPGALLLTALCIDRGRPRAAFWLAVIPMALVWAHYVALPWTGRVGLLGLGTATWLVASLVVCLRIARNEQPTPATEVFYSRVGKGTGSRKRQIGGARLHPSDPRLAAPRFSIEDAPVPVATSPAGDSGRR